MSLNVLQYLISLRPALPMSREHPCTYTSNSELRRWVADGSVLINNERWAASEESPAYVWSLVFFPRARSRTTII